MATVHFDNISRRYPGMERPAVDQLDLTIEDGEFLVLVGPSGCGKSTTLRMLAGLEPISDGRLLIGDRDVTEVEPRHRDIAMVFQSYALYPHMTVGENIGFALKLSKVPKDEIATRVQEVSELLELDTLLDRKPSKLSGGQRQRVAMGRAIVRRPQVFLMDEPLSNLDAKLRVQTRTQIAALQARLGVTTMYVTHDQVEAMTLGHRVAVLHQGRLQQCAPPRELFARPANLFVAGFIGSPAMNLLACTVDGEEAVLGGMRVPLTRSQRAGLATGGVTVGVRPEGLRVLGADESSPTGAIEATVSVIEELGSDSYLHLDSEVQGLREHGESNLVVREPGLSLRNRGERLRLAVDTTALHLFDTATGERLPETAGGVVTLGASATSV